MVFAPSSNISKQENLMWNLKEIAYEKLSVSFFSFLGR